MGGQKNMFNVGTISQSKLLPAILHPKLMALCINLFGDLFYLLYKICIQQPATEIGFRKIFRFNSSCLQFYQSICYQYSACYFQKIKLSANLFCTNSINKQVPGCDEKQIVYLSSSRNDNVPNYLRMTYNGFVNSTWWG